MSDGDYYSSIKKRLLREKGLDIEDLGYNLSCGLGKKDGKISLEARLQPLPGSPDPINEDLFTRIKIYLEIYLKDIDENISLNLQYTGNITAQKK